MVNDNYDVIVIGAGPIGGYLAWKLRTHGLTVLLLEEHSEIGRPFQCAGMVNPSAMERVGALDTVLTRIWGARMYSPSGTEIQIGKPETTRTWSVCRKLFDERVVKLALDSGVDLLLSSKPINANVKNSGVEISIDVGGEIKQFECRLLCGADGAHSWVRRTFKMGRPKELMIGFQIEVTGYRGAEGRLDLFTGEDIAPGFFAWAIPSGTTTRIGNWTLPEKLGERSCEDLLETLMTSPLWSDRFSNCREIGRYCGPVPSGLVHKPVIDRVAVFGDAAGLCKPTTGGGIGKGFDQVDLMLERLVEAVKTNDFCPNTIQDLNTTISSLRRSQNKSRALRNVFLTESTDEDLDELFEVWAQTDVIELINEIGEIDNPIPLGIKMLKDVPEFRRLASKAATALIWG
ncbi:MAG: NAD(P)/FAD-dependent oxidoreductase [Candidatus Thermoplasmatota archaeon]|nr:NAD(P)/FAD-dependent oxidoreductase [Candidatus Thermoplasmatota archaeon]